MFVNVFNSWLHRVRTEGKVSDNKLTVMYVPPMSGSETRVWKAEMPTNWTVLRGTISEERIKIMYRLRGEGR